MSTTIATSGSSAAARSRPVRAPKLKPWLRKSLLVVHVVAAGAWLGIDVIVAVLVGAGWFSDVPAVQGVAYQALGRFIVAPMLVAGLLCLVTGLALGLGTKWGLVRYWWVAVKLALNVALCILIVVLLRPGMADVRGYGAALSTGAPVTENMSGDPASLFFPPAVSLTALTIAITLSVFKPWGRIRAARPATGRNRS